MAVVCRGHIFLSLSPAARRGIGPATGRYGLPQPLTRLLRVYGFVGHFRRSRRPGNTCLCLTYAAGRETACAVIPFSRTRFIVRVTTRNGSCLVRRKASQKAAWPFGPYRHASRFRVPATRGGLTVAARYGL